jgi:hypothetical protein
VIAMPLVELIVRNLSRHLALLRSDVVFVFKTALLVLWLCMGWYRETFEFSFEVEFGMHVAIELAISAIPWRKVLGFAGIIVEMARPFMCVAAFSFGSAFFELFSVGFRRAVMSLLWNCMFPKVMVMYLLVVFRKLWGNHGRLFM